MKIKEVISALEQFAPLPLQEGWDNSGLQIGLTEAEEVSGALLCLDIDERIIDEAMAKGCNMIVSHHPLLFKGLKRISSDNYVARCVAKAIKNDITIVSMHTNLDNAKGGVNYRIAEKLGLRGVKFLSPRMMEGTECGSGTIGEFDTPMAAGDFIEKVKATFGARCAMTNELMRRSIKRVAVCGGAGDFMVDDAIRHGADAFITGEMHYHVYFAHEQEIQICVIGHYESEQYTSEILQEVINRECPGVRTFVAEHVTNPIACM